MLQSAQRLHLATVQGLDGPAGRIAQFLFDDVTWRVRHIAVRTGGWLTGRCVLLSPIAVTQVSAHERAVYVEYTRAQVASCPDLYSDPPVTERPVLMITSRAYYPPIWYEPGLWACSQYMAGEADQAEGEAYGDGYDPHLQGTRDVAGYTIAARDATFGRLADVVLDDASWTVRSFVVDTRPWWPKLVVISRDVVRLFDCSAGMVTVDMWRDAIERAPAFSSVLQHSYSPSASPSR